MVEASPHFMPSSRDFAVRLPSLKPPTPDVARTALCWPWHISHTPFSSQRLHESRINSVENTASLFIPIQLFKLLSFYLASLAYLGVDYRTLLILQHSPVTTDTQYQFNTHSLRPPFQPLPRNASNYCKLSKFVIHLPQIAFQPLGEVITCLP